ncbi:MAG: site-2 protease family protein [Bradymonadaceae bacterium]
MFGNERGFHFFTAFGIDVSVSLWYLLLMAFIIFPMGSGAAMASGLVHGILFAVAVTISLLVHEYGHGFVSKSYGLNPSIMLHAFGGLCSHRHAESDGDDAIILFAGPGAGLILGGIALAAQFLVVPALGNPLLGSFVGYLVWVNIAWSLVNLLLPIWPLDGGKLFHLLMRRFTADAEARSIALKISLGATVIGGLLAVSTFGSFFLALLAFFIVMDNVRMLQSGQPLVRRASPASSGPSDFQNELLEDARQALEAENFDEAYRLCHQLRASGGSLDTETLEEVWTILAVSSVELDKLDEADSYLDRAPNTDEVERAREEWERRNAEADEDEAA